jgi:hypothetical protein
MLCLGRLRLKPMNNCDLLTKYPRLWSIRYFIWVTLLWKTRLRLSGLAVRLKNKKLAEFLVVGSSVRIKVCPKT